jgi:F-type H+-transporting ATPase subunit b
METLGRFGLDPVILVAQIVNFLVIAFVLERFLLRPVRARLDARKQKIAQGLRDAEEAGRTLAETRAQRERILGEARAEAAALMEKALGEADRARAQAADRAREEAEAILGEARQRVEAERREAEAAVGNLALELSGRILENVVGSLFNAEEKTGIMARGMERIRAMRPGGPS